MSTLLLQTAMNAQSKLATVVGSDYTLPELVDRMELGPQEYEHFVAHTRRQVEQLVNMGPEIVDTYPSQIVLQRWIRETARVVAKFPGSIFATNFKTQLAELLEGDARIPVRDAVHDALRQLRLDDVPVKPVDTKACLRLYVWRSIFNKLPKECLDLYQSVCMESFGTEKGRMYLIMLTNHVVRELNECSTQITTESCPYYFELVGWLQTRGFVITNEICHILKRLVSRVTQKETKLPVSVQLCRALGTPTLTSLVFINWIALQYPNAAKSFQSSMVQLLESYAEPLDKLFVGLCVFLFRCPIESYDTMIEKVKTSNQHWVQYEIVKEAMIHGLYNVAGALVGQLISVAESEATLHWLTALKDIAACNGEEFTAVVSLTAAAQVSGQSFDFQTKYLELRAQRNKIRRHVEYITSILSLSERRWMPQQTLETVEKKMKGLVQEYSSFYDQCYGMDDQTLDAIDVERQYTALLLYAFQCSIRAPKDQVTTLKWQDSSSHAQYQHLYQELRSHCEGETVIPSSLIGEFVQLVHAIPLRVPRAFFRFRRPFEVQVYLFDSICSLDQITVAPSSSASEICVRHESDFVGRLETRLRLNPVSQDPEHRRRQLLTQIKSIRYKFVLRRPDGGIYDQLEPIDTPFDAKQLFACCPVQFPSVAFDSTGTYGLLIDVHCLVDGKEWVLSSGTQQSVVVY